MNDKHTPINFAPKMDGKLPMLQVGADAMTELLSHRFEVVPTPWSPTTLAAPEAATSAQDDVAERLSSLERRLQNVEAELQEHGRLGGPSISASLERIADALTARKEVIGGTAPKAKKAKGVPSVQDFREDDLPAEVSTAQAAEILGVSKDTVLAYRQKGLLPFRDTAPPGSSKPAYLYPMKAVVKLRTGYQTEQAAPTVPAESPRRQVKGERKYKHLDVDG
jgi:hypothetical protein